MRDDIPDAPSMEWIENHIKEYLNRNYSEDQYTEDMPELWLADRWRAEIKKYWSNVTQEELESRSSEVIFWEKELKKAQVVSTVPGWKQMWIFLIRNSDG